MFLGTRGEHIDRIFRVIWDGPEDYEKISENIFELIRGLVEVEDPEGLFDGEGYSSLSKEWGDDFWKVI